MLIVWLVVRVILWIIAAIVLFVALCLTIPVKYFFRGEAGQNSTFEARIVWGLFAFKGVYVKGRFESSVTFCFLRLKKRKKSEIVKKEVKKEQEKENINEEEKKEEKKEKLKFSDVIKNIKNLKNNGDKTVKIYQTGIIGDLKLYLKKIILSIRPNKFKLKGRFGFDNPSHTAYVMGFCHAFAGIFNINFVSLTPNFNEKIADFSFEAKGWFVPARIIIRSMSLFFKKSLRQTIKLLREKK